MDPDATLLAIRELVGAHDQDDAETVGTAMDRLDGLCELVAGLDVWLSVGGFAPRAWCMSQGLDGKVK